MKYKNDSWYVAQIDGTWKEIKTEDLESFSSYGCTIKSGKELNET